MTSSIWMSIASTSRWPNTTASDCTNGVAGPDMRVNTATLPSSLLPVVALLSAGASSVNATPMAQSRLSSARCIVSTVSMPGLEAAVLV